MEYAHKGMVRVLTLVAYTCRMTHNCVDNTETQTRDKIKHGTQVDKVQMGSYLKDKLNKEGDVICVIDSWSCVFVL